MKTKKANNRKYVDVEESNLLVLKAIGEFIGQDGKLHVKTKWFLCDEELNLGSSAEPNKEILAIKYETPPPPNPMSDLFGGLFGKR